MNDHRWRDVFHALDSMRRHLGESVQLFEEGGLEGRERQSYQRQMILMHTMEIGYTSFEAALLRIMELLGEVPPTGSGWHAQLIARAADAIPNLRPPILARDLANAANTVKNFRHWATRGYDSDFIAADATGAISAARVLLADAYEALESFARAIDP